MFSKILVCDNIGLLYCDEKDIEKYIDSSSQLRTFDNKRIAKCTSCGKISSVENFSCYGMPKVNYGLCRDCVRKQQDCCKK